MMNVPPGHVQSVDINTEQRGEFIMSDSRFMEIYDPRVGHHMAVQSMISNNGMANASLLLYMCAKIDGEPVSMSDILSMKPKDYEKACNILFK